MFPELSCACAVARVGRRRGCRGSSGVGGGHLGFQGIGRKNEGDDVKDMGACLLCSPALLHKKKTDNPSACVWSYDREGGAPWFWCQKGNGVVWLAKMNVRQGWRIADYSPNVFAVLW